MTETLAQGNLQMFEQARVAGFDFRVELAGKALSRHHFKLQPGRQEQPEAAQGGLVGGPTQGPAEQEWATGIRGWGFRGRQRPGRNPQHGFMQQLLLGIGEAIVTGLPPGERDGRKDGFVHDFGGGFPFQLRGEEFLGFGLITRDEPLVEHHKGF